MTTVPSLATNAVNDTNNRFGKANISRNFLASYAVYTLCVRALAKSHRTCAMAKASIWRPSDVRSNFVAYFENVLKSLRYEFFGLTRANTCLRLAHKIQICRFKPQQSKKDDKNC